MKKQIAFRVQDSLPPKKDGAASMWAKSAEIPRLIALRKAALEAMGSNTPLRRNITLKLTIYYSKQELVRAGDLDNFITGVCDGLMAANPGIKKHPRWSDAKLDTIKPDVTVAIADDSEVISIHATKTGTENGVWYDVVLEGET